jgi:two-component system KDP operon response regulator KdpE
LSSQTSGPLVLVIEDDPQVRRFLETSLGMHGFRPVVGESGELGLRLAAQYVPELVLLDLGLPDLDGLEVIRRLRPWCRAPVVVLSARGQERQKVEALDAGADDYLTKPFGLPELLARLRVALRRASRGPANAGQEPFECGPLRADLAARRVWLHGAEVHLTPLEFKLLAVLVRQAGRIVTQRQLLQEVWGPHSLDQAHYLRVYMTHLRRKLEPARALFRTEAGVGYGLECPEEGPTH